MLLCCRCCCCCCCCCVVVVVSRTVFMWDFLFLLYCRSLRKRSGQSAFGQRHLYVHATTLGLIQLLHDQLMMMKNSPFLYLWSKKKNSLNWKLVFNIYCSAQRPPSQSWFAFVSVLFSMLSRLLSLDSILQWCSTHHHHEQNISDCNLLFSTNSNWIKGKLHCRAQYW